MTGQTLSFAVGPRDLESGKKLMEGIPEDYRRKQFYTDGLVRKSMSFARSILWFWRRLRFVLHKRNERIKQAWMNKYKQGK